MIHINLYWYGDELTEELKLCLQTCISQYTNEATDNFNVFAMPNIVEGTTNVPFWYRRRLFLAIFREDFVIVIEDNDLNIRILIEDLWDCYPANYLELTFFAEFVSYIGEN